MKTNIKPENRRLLEAIEYIDEEIILGVLAGLKQPAENYEPGEYQKPSPFKYWRQFTAMAACLLLLSAAFPVINYVLPRIGFSAGTWEGNAGAEIENTDYFNYSSDMPVEEVLADVIEKGYFVISDGKCISGREKWDDFLKSVENGDPATVKIAYHESYEWVASSTSGSHTNLDDFPTISLRAVEYNGKTFKFISKTHKLDTTFEKEYPYIVSYDLGTRTTYCVSLLTKEELSVTDPSNPFAKACGHGSSISSDLADQCDCLKVIIFLD